MVPTDSISADMKVKKAMDLVKEKAVVKKARKSIKAAAKETNE
jgi:hypothetical protein